MRFVADTLRVADVAAVRSLLAMWTEAIQPAELSQGLTRRSGGWSCDGR
jgi:hypothetical protein